MVRSDERAWIYVERSETRFVRREIVLGHPAADGWFLSRGSPDGDRVVTTAAQMLLSEERKVRIKIECWGTDEGMGTKELFWRVFGLRDNSPVPIPLSARVSRIRVLAC